MARIRIVDEWLRSPVSTPTRYRSVMVVADSWGEQRVLMRAYQNAPDQTRPTIVLHGTELAIGPAGMEAYGPWGIHVEPPVDGRAQELRLQLELAARRMAGSKGNPPRLEDEQNRFEGRRTGVWLPGQQPVTAPPPMPSPAQQETMQVYEPVVAAAQSRGWQSPVTPVPAREVLPTPNVVPPPRGVGAATAHGFATGPVRRKPPTAPPPTGEVIPRRFERLVSRTLPMGFQLTGPERDVLNALADATLLTARKIAEIARVSDPIGWMEQLMSKLGEMGLELVVPGEAIGGEPTYRLRR
jgi:hypothetical protein